MVEETKLKVGDILVCHSEVIMNGSDGTDIRTTVGKLYKIFCFRRMFEKDCFVITDDSASDHYFLINNYKERFYSLKELRRNKLKKIEAQKNSN